MKHRIFILSCIFLCGVGVLASVLVYAAFHRPRTRHYGVLELPDGTIDLGVLGVGEKASTTFPIRNISAKQIKITNLVPSCGCTDAHIDTLTLTPGQTAHVTVVFDGTGFFRRVEKQVWIETDDEARPPVAVGFTAYVRVGTRVDIKSLDLGHVRFGEVLHTAVVNVLTDPDLKREIVSVTGNVDDVRVKIGNWQQVDDVVQNPITFNSAPVSGDLGDHLIHLNVHVGELSFPVSLHYTIDPVVSVEPKVVDFGRGEPGSEADIVVSSTCDIHSFTSAKSVYGKCGASITASKQRGCVIHVVQKTVVPAFDVLRIEYVVSPDRVESVDVPVTVRRAVSAL